MHRADDLVRGDPFQVGAGGREVRVPELALDQRQRNALMQQLDGVGMAELVLVPTSAQPSLSRPGRYAEAGEKLAFQEDLGPDAVGIFRGPRGT